MVYKNATPEGLFGALNSAPMSDHLVRVENLQKLKRDRKWTDADLARACSRLPQQLRSWWAFPERGGRQIGEKLARSLEEELNLPRYFLDERPRASAMLTAREGGGTHNTYTQQQATSSAAPNVGTQVPVLAWDQLKDMLLVANELLDKALPTLDTFADHSRAAKFIQMPDDSMEPVFSEGDHILFDPSEAPRAGDTVLVALASGEHLVRLFKPRSAHHWEAAPINTNYQALSSTEDEAATVVAVMIEHRRYRRRRA